MDFVDVFDSVIRKLTMDMIDCIIHINAIFNSYKGECTFLVVIFKGEFKSH